jgi:hypothetical protein
MLPVAALLAADGRGAIQAAAVLALAGGVLMLLFQGVGARIPQDIADPLRDAVWPLWRGDPLPPWTDGHRFARNAVAWIAPATIASLPEGVRWVQFLPLALAQAAAIAAMTYAL